MSFAEKYNTPEGDKKRTRKKSHAENNAKGALKRKKRAARARMTPEQIADEEERLAEEIAALIAAGKVKKCLPVLCLRQ